MTTTIFLADATTLRISTPYSDASRAALNAIQGAHWDAPTKTWRAPVAKFDAVLRIFGDACAVAPEVVMAAAPTLPIEHFAQTCAWAGVHLRIEGERVIGSGGAWTPVLQAEIDKRAVPLRRLIASGWQAPQVDAPPPAPVPASLDRITHMDRVMAAGEANARKNAEREQGYREAAKRARFAAMRQESLLEEELP